MRYKYLFIFIIFFLVSSCSKKQQVTNEKESLSFLQLEKRCSGYPLDLNERLIDIHGDSIFFHEIIQCDSVFFFFYKSSFCNMCVESVLDDLNKLNTVEGRNMKILFYSENIRHFFIDYINKKSNIEAFFLVDGNLGSELDQLQLPYLFLCRDGRMWDVKISHYTRERELKSYLERLKFNH